MLDKIKKIVEEQLGVDASSINENTRMIEDLKADSLDLMQMIMTVEEEFNTLFGDEEIKKLKTVGDVMAFLNKK